VTPSTQMSEEERHDDAVRQELRVIDDARGSRTTPYVMCAWSRASCQCAMGREANTSSRIAVSAAELAACLRRNPEARVRQEVRRPYRRQRLPPGWQRGSAGTGVVPSSDRRSSSVRRTLPSCSGKNSRRRARPGSGHRRTTRLGRSGDVVTCAPFPVRSRRYRPMTIAEKRPTAVA